MKNLGRLEKKARFESKARFEMLKGTKPGNWWVGHFFVLEHSEQNKSSSQARKHYSYNIPCAPDEREEKPVKAVHWGNLD